MAPKTILVINGPNLNLLGYREPHIYGSTTLAEVLSVLNFHCDRLSSISETPSTTADTNKHSNKVTLLSYQSNSSGQIIDRIHSAFQSNLAASKPAPSLLSPDVEIREGTVDAIIINPGGLTHTSVSLRDALAGASIPFVEVHITNVHAREEFRQKSFLSEKAVGVICGLGVYGYVAALEFLVGSYLK